ncbi:MAG: DNA translocase FtsK [Planctomycetaceae bacterium]
MIDVAAAWRRAADALRPHRSLLLAFFAAALSFGLAGILLSTPGLGETPWEGTLPRHLARALAIAFGPAAALLLILAGLHALLHLLGRGISFPPQRIAAAAALLILLPCLFSVAGGGERGGGGVLGLLAGDAVLLLFPRLFAVPLLLGMVLFALILSTDWLFYALLRPSAAVAAPARRPALRRSPAPAPLPTPQPTEAPPPLAEVEEEELEEEEEISSLAPPPESTTQLTFCETEDADAKPRGKSNLPPLPGMELLEPGETIDLGRLERTIKENGAILEKALASFKVEAVVVGYTRGPVITMYELALKEGTKLSQIVNLSDDLAIALKAESVRVVAPIPGKSTVGVEVPNALRDDVRLHGLLAERSTAVEKMAVPLFLGRNASGVAMIDDLAGMPHLLIAGATGSGKSVCINSIILSVLLTRRPEEVKLILIDPKQVELAFFREVPHLLTAVVTDVRRAAQALDWVVSEMEDRYWIFARFGVRNITAYNRLGARKVRQLAKEHDIGEEKAPERMPYLVVVVDELADLIMTGRKEVEQAVTRLAQKSRAVGIHTVLATQRPSTDVITGLIKANMPCRTAFKVTSKVDSRVVLDQNGAEKLLGRGDMLFLPPRSFNLMRCQGTYVADAEVKKVVDYLKQTVAPPELRELFVRPETLDDRDPREVDDLFDSACRIVIESRRGSASLLQRALGIGYTRASRLVDLMRSQGIIGEFKNAQAAEVLLTLEEYESRYKASES